MKCPLILLGLAWVAPWAAPRADASPTVPAQGSQLTDTVTNPREIDAPGTPGKDSRFEAALSLLQEGTPGERWQGAWTLREWGAEAAPAVSALLPLLEEGQADLRWVAARTLGSIGPEAHGGVGALVRVLEDPDHDVRWAAVDALGSILGTPRGSMGAGTGAQGTPSDEHPDLQRVIEGLTGALGDPETSVRASAALALGRIGPPASSARAALLTRARLGEHEATLALGKLGGSGPGGTAVVADLIDLLGRCHRGEMPVETTERLAWCCGEALVELGLASDTDVDRLLAMASESNPSTEGAALWAATGGSGGSTGTEANRESRTSSDRVLDALAGSAESKVRSTRWAASRGLARLGYDTPIAREALTRLATDSDRRVRLLAAEALVALPHLGGDAGDEECRVLGELLAEPREELRRGFLEALAGSPRSREWTRALRSGDPPRLPTPADHRAETWEQSLRGQLVVALMFGDDFDSSPSVTPSVSSSGSPSVSPTVSPSGPGTPSTPSDEGPAIAAAEVPDPSPVNTIGEDTVLAPSSGSPGTEPSTDRKVGPVAQSDVVANPAGPHSPDAIPTESEPPAQVPSDGVADPAPGAVVEVPDPNTVDTVATARGPSTPTEVELVEPPGVAPELARPGVVSPGSPPADPSGSSTSEEPRRTAAWVLGLLALLLAPTLLAAALFAVAPGALTTLHGAVDRLRSGHLRRALDLVLLGSLRNHPRLVDPWMRERQGRARAAFEARATVRSRSIHVPTPLGVGERVIWSPSDVELAQLFSERPARRTILGEGGAGKTSLACHLGRTILARVGVETPGEPPLWPILIEGPFDAPRGHEAECLIQRIEASLTELRADDDRGRAPLEGLLHQGRLMILVDGWSELGARTRRALGVALAEIEGLGWLITSRTEGEVPMAREGVLRPQRIEGERLAGFLGRWLEHRGVRHRLEDPDFFEACTRLTRLVGPRELTPMFAVLYAERCLEAVEEGPLGAGLPGSLPELMEGWVDRAYREATDVRPGKRPSKTRLRSDVQRLAWEAVREHLRPMPLDRTRAIAALRDEFDGSSEPWMTPEGRLDWIVEDLGLLDAHGLGGQSLRFHLDPPAESMAAAELSRRLGSDEAGWKEFLERADQESGAPASIRGFLLALREVLSEPKVLARPRSFHAGPSRPSAAILEALAQRTGLDSERLRQRQIERRVARLLASLGAPDPRARVEVLVALGSLGPAAREASLALRACLEDPDPAVRDGAISCLARIGVGVVPELIEDLDHPVVQRAQGAARALGALGPEARAAAHALGLALGRPELAGHAATALALLGSAATGALPQLLGAVPAAQGPVLAQVLRALGGLGEAATPALPALVSCLERPGAECLAAESLGRLGPVARDAVPALRALIHAEPSTEGSARDIDFATEAVDDPVAGPFARPAPVSGARVLVRSAAASALGSIGKAATPAVPELLELLGDPNELLRDEACDALGRILADAPEPLAEVIVALGGDRRVVREGVAHAITRAARRAPATRASLERLRERQDPGQIREALGDALAELDPI